MRRALVLLLALMASACSDSTVGTNNSPPEASIVQPAPGTVVEEGTPVALEGLVVDSGTPLADLEVTWTSSLDGELAAGFATEYGVTEETAEDLSAGEHTITLQVRDAQGASDQATTTVTVTTPNSAPTCAITAPESLTTFALGELVLLEGEVADADVAADTLAVSFSSNVDGALGDATPSTAGAVALGITTLTADTHTISMNVEDADGGTCSDFIVVTVEAGNAPPTAPGVSITPAAPVTGDDLTATISTPALDTDGPAAVTYTYAWTRDSVAAGPFVPPETVPASETAAAEVWEVTVTAFDGELTSAAATASVTVENTPPSITGVAITPTTAYTDTQLTATPSGWLDADGEAEDYVYAWFADASAVGTDSATLDGSEFARDEEITVEVTPVDAVSSGASVLSAGVTILNSLPTTPGVTITPASPTDADTLTCAVSTPSTDADPGDSVGYGYGWSNGSTSVSGATLASTSTVANETWTCTVTPTDGTDPGVAGTAAVTIASSSSCANGGPSPNTCGAGCASPASCLNNWSTLSCAPPTVTAAYFTSCSSIPFGGANWCFVVEGDNFQLDYTTQNGNMKWGSARSGGFSGSNWNWLYADQLVVTVGSWYSNYVGMEFWIENPDGQQSDCVTIGFQ